MSNADDLPPGDPDLGSPTEPPEAASPDETVEADSPEGAERPGASARPTLPPILTRRRASVVGAMVVVLTVALAASLLQPWSPGPGGPSSTGPGGPSTTGPVPTGTGFPSGSAGVPGAGGTGEASPTPGLPGGDWTTVDVPPVARIADLTPTDLDGAGLGVRSRFTLTSLGGVSAVELARSLITAPASQLKVSPGPTRETAVITPQSDLAEGTWYRFALRVGGTVAESWVYRTREPLAINGTIPGSETTNVPVDTGIEVTFNQDGVGDISSFFSIRPRVTGTFERHGRAWVFVPEPLRPGTIYTVTVRKGIPIQDSDLVLERDHQFSFETAPKLAAPPASGERQQPLAPLGVEFPRDVVEVVPTDLPVVDVWIEQPGSHDTRSPLTQLDLRVYRLPTVAATVAAIRSLRGAPGWADWSDQGLVPTKDLAEVASFEARVQTVGEGKDARDFVEFPMRLEPGWYLVAHHSAARDEQAVLEVTDVATFVTFSDTKSLVWVNDVRSGGPIADAAILTADGLELGRTDADGLATLDMPAGDLFLVAAPDAGPPTDLAMGRAAIVPAGTGGSDDDDYYGYDDEYRSNAYWLLVHTDRALYRSTDEIDVWGVVRRRDDGAIPSTLVLRLTNDWTWDSDGAADLPVTKITVKPDSRTGVFTGQVTLDDVPKGGYALAIWSGKDQVASRFIQVSEIEKPAYRMSLALDRRFVLVGETVTATVRTEFFEGSPAPGLEIGVEGLGDGLATKTDADGVARFSSTTGWPTDGSRDGTRTPYVYARPIGPEESGIESEWLDYVLFPSRLLLDVDASIAGDGISVAGSVHALDLARAEREWAASAGTAGDAHGPAVAGSSVKVEVTDHWYVAIKTGRKYDPISKRAYDTFEDEAREKVLASTTVASGADGAFRLEIDRAAPGKVPPKGHDYEVALTASDSDGRVVQATTYASVPDTSRGPVWTEGSSVLELELGAGVEDRTYAVDAEMRLPLTWGGALPPTGVADRFLYYTGNRGLGDAVVTTAPEFVHRFSLADLPRLTARAVWFTGQTYVASEDYVAEYDPEDRGLVVTATPDKARYEPGDQVTLRVRTTRTDGTPVPASVVLRAIDEKLYAINAAWTVEVLESLYTWIDDGLGSSYGSHPVPRTTVRRPTGECANGCSTTGGGDDGGVLRDDFRDVVLFRHVRTDADGRATVRFTLSDDLTSWRLSAAAISRDLRAGQSSVALTVGLPLFIEAPVAAEYVASDRPVIRVRAYGAALRSGQGVVVTASAPSLGMTSSVVNGTAFTGIGIQLPALTVGDHDVRITATTRSGSRTLSDTLVRTIHVLPSRFTETRTTYAILTSGVPKPAAIGTTTYVFMDAGRGKYLPAIRSLAGTQGDRIDQRLAASAAYGLLANGFGLDVDSTSRPQLGLSEYLKQPSGVAFGGRALALLPYGSPDLGLSVRVALLVPDSVADLHDLSDYFSKIRSAATTTREERNLALAGLAGMGGASALDVRAALSEPGLTVRERLYLALAAATLGDFDAARPIEQDVLARFGQRLGPWVRLAVSTDPAAVNEATSLLGILSLRLGDPIATAAEMYVEENPTTEDLSILQQVVFIRESLERLSSAVASFEYSVGDTRRVVKLERGGSHRLTLAPSQVESLSARSLSGSVAIDVTWAELTSRGRSPVDPSLGLDRTIVPSSPVPAGSVVSVILTPRYGGMTITGCYRVEDLVPSGLKPVWTVPGGVPRGEYDPEPSEISGQRVVFCASSSRPEARLIYYARVVTPGDYVWEPATMRSERAPESGTLAPTARVVLR